MAKELRCVFFEPEEVRAALVLFLSRRGGIASYSDMPRVVLAQTPDGLRAQVIPPKGAGATLDPDEVLGAILAFCRSCNIPLAIKSAKQVEAFGEGIALVAYKNFATRPPEIAESRVSYLNPELRDAISAMIAAA